MAFGYPLTVAGAVTALAPFGSSVPCSLLIPWTWSVGEPSTGQGLHRGRRRVKPARAKASAAARKADATAGILVDRLGEQQDHAARRLLVEGRDVHQAHAVVEAAHQQRTDQGAQHPPLAALERGAADDG